MTMLRIKEIIRQQQLTYRDIADKLGVTPQYVSGVVNESENVTEKVLAQFADILHVPMAALFDGYVEPHPLPDESHAFCPYCGHRLKIGRGD